MPAPVPPQIEPQINTLIVFESLSAKDSKGLKRYSSSNLMNARI